MKVDTAIEHIRLWLDGDQVSQIVVHKQPGTTGEVTLQMTQQFREEPHLENAVKDRR